MMIPYKVSHVTQNGTNYVSLKQDILQVSMRLTSLHKINVIGHRIQLNESFFSQVKLTVRV